MSNGVNGKTKANVCLELVAADGNGMDGRVVAHSNVESSTPSSSPKKNSIFSTVSSFYLSPHQTTLAMIGWV